MLAGDKKPLSRMQARVASATVIAAMQETGHLVTQVLGWCADDRSSIHFADQFSGPHRDLIVVHQSPSVASAVLPLSNLRNVTAGLDFAAEKRPLC